MARPLVATKLYVPRVRRGLVSRPRLAALLGRGVEAKLTLVSAPAGFGKTTLLAEWLTAAPEGDRAVAWLSLDASDSAPSSFWTYVVNAVQGAVPSVGSGALKLLASTPLSTDLVLTTLLNDLATAPGELWLVLDDYHLVDSTDIRQSMSFLLSHLPPHVHVVLSTRADPDLPLARWRARSELLEIRAGDLRFTPDEAASYLDEATGLSLPAKDLEVLEERTEGWIAALQLAALSIRGHDNPSGFIARFAGNDRYIVDYLVEEVLQHQPESVRGFLLYTAVLDRLTGPLCDAVTGCDDGSRMLASLERANLFLVSLDDQREWYRYHHLFADVLRARLLAEQPEQASMLHQRASRWYEAHNVTEEAVRHALAAGDFNRAAHLIELAVPSVRRHRQEAMLFGWLTALPDDIVRASPVLSVFRGYMLMVAGDLDAVEPRLDDAERALSSVPTGSVPPWADTDDLRTVPAMIAVYRASLAQARGDVTGTGEHARRALELAGPHDHLARGSAAGLLGLAAWASGDVPGALETFGQAMVSLHAAGNLVDELSSTVVLADLWLAAGRPSKARQLYERALQVAEAQGEPVARATAELHVGLSEIDLEAADLESARSHLQIAATLGRAAMTESRYRWFVATARVTQAAGDPDQAIQLLEQAEQLFRPGFFPDVRPIAAIRARVWIAQGKLAEAADWTRQQGLSTSDSASYLREFDHLTLVRLILAQHRAQPGAVELVQAASLLGRLFELAATSGRAGSRLEIRLLQALADDAQGHRPRALASLADAVELAPEPRAYGRLFLDEGAPMVGLLTDADHQGIAGGHPRRLLRLADAVRADAVQADAADVGLRASRPVALRLTERELQVLRLLDSELSGPQIARELFVSHNTVRTHTKRIFTKLDVTDRRAAVRRAHDRGLM